MLTSDLTQRCVNLGDGRKELQLQTQGCSVATVELAGQAALLWTGRTLDTARIIAKVERVLEWMMPAGEVRGIGR